MMTLEGTASRATRQEKTCRVGSSGRARRQDFMLAAGEIVQSVEPRVHDLRNLRHIHKMSVRQAPPYQQGAPERRAPDDSDEDEDALAGEFEEQNGYQDGDGYDMDRRGSMGAGVDLREQLIAAAQPLEYGASLDVKVQSYDSYCNLFHFILNSDGPVDVEVPSVRRTGRTGKALGDRC